jgi:hypothetical protein
LDVICLDTPSGEAEVYSSYDLSIFTPKTVAQFSEGGGNAPEGSSSVSIGELWAKIDMMDAICQGCTSTGNVPWNTYHERRSMPLVEMTEECTGRTDKGDLLDDAPGPSNARPRSRGRGRRKYSMKNKDAQILSAAPRAISPRMRKSFVDRQYLPSTGIDLSERKIILDELTHMGYIVKKEPNSDGNE